ncbi:MAG: RICIN domain-containing protein, partial [Oscillospiraceae bacterium]|nr:RICIN domain-containing protein [Oscillospiraceae bacterium]
RITALLTVLVMMLLWTVQPSSAAAAATSGSDAAGSGTEKSAQTVLNELSDEGCPVYLSPVAAPNAMVDASPEGVLQLWSLRVGKTHSWFLDKVDTHYLIKDAVTGMVIEVEGGTAKNNARLRLGVQRKSDDQLWSITPVPGEQRYTIASKLDPSFVMDDAAAKSDNGNPVILFKGDGKSPNQKFTITRAVTETLVDDFQRYGTDENYKFVPLHAGHMVVDLNGGGNQSYVHLWTAVHTGDQEISMHKLENSDYYYFEHPVSHKVVSIANGNVWGGVGLAMTGYTGDDWQLWRLEPLGDGTYVIHSKANDDLVWDCHNQGTYNDTRVEVYPVNKLSHQRFRISHATTVEPVSEWGAHLKSTQSQSWSLWDGDDTYTGWYWNHEYDSDFYVSTASEFAGISYLVRHGHQFFEGRTIHLTCDINLAGIEWIKIGSLSNPFMGHLNGHGHTITGLSMTKSAEADDYIGLFGRIYKGSVSNLAVKGKVCGDEFVGGIVGYIDCGQLYNVYSEVTITKGTYRYLGGICGYAGSQTYIEHCTQNAMVNSGDQDSYRGGIAGAFDGVMRYNTHLNTVYCNWNWVGGIMGCGTNMIAEYCANYGTVGGGGYAERVGGICGEVFGDCIIYACCNEGEVYSLGDDWVGGICGKATNWFRTVHGCINAGWISGDHCIGGIIGEGRASSCLNVGKVTGSTKLGAISGKAPSADSCVAL